MDVQVWVFSYPGNKEEDYTLNQTCLPQNTFVSTPNSLCLYFLIFDRILTGCTTIPLK